MVLNNKFLCRGESEVWRDDNDRINDLFLNLRSIKHFPAECPIRKRNSAHLYMDIHNPNTRRGGLWVWCNECYTFSHCSIYVPEYWETSTMISKEKLCAIPDYLNHISDVVDAHVNRILANWVVEKND